MQQPKIVYVNSDETAVFVCPHCGASKTTSVSKFKNQRGAIKVRCACKEVYRTQLEFRKTWRKSTELNGLYTKASDETMGGRMVVKNISQGGVGFVTKSKNRLEIGDLINLKFNLDDTEKSQIRKRAVVRVVEENYTGCQFTDISGTYDKALGFYLKR
ncbi:MAG: PilZ domain-containing protein [Desulfatibacillum sp.]|nr:PilZ domain-containing protein [Desulfatibacillum sp.]